MTQAVFLYSAQSCTLSITKFNQTKSLNMTFEFLNLFKGCFGITVESDLKYKESEPFLL